MPAARLDAWMTVIADRANPMLVRRVRQELRSKTFIGAYLLMLLIAVIAAAVASSSDASGAGRGMFTAVASAWTALLCLSALATSRAIIGDRGGAAWDLIELTGMRPLAIVAGVAQSSLVLGLLGAAGLAPFLVMSYLLRGLDLPTVVFALLTLPLIGALLGAVGATLACLGSNRQARQGGGLLLALMLLSAWGMLTGLWGSSEHGLSRWLAAILRGDLDSIAGLGAILNAWLAALALVLTLGATLLTHRAQDRSSPLRLVWCLIWLNGLGWLFGLLWWHGLSRAEEPFHVAATIGVAWGLVLGLFAITEDLDITPRQRQAVDSGGRLRRTAMTLFGPGGGRGARCTLLLVGGSVLVALPWLPDAPALILACYGLAVLVSGDLVARGPLARVCVTPLSRRICTIAVLLVVGLVPSLAALFADGSERHVLLVLSPFSGPVELFGRGGEPSSHIATWVLLGVGLVAALYLVQRSRQEGSGQARITARPDDADPRT